MSAGSRVRAAALGLYCLFLIACSEPGGSGTAQTPAPADSVLWHGRIYTLEAAQPWVEAVAIRDGRYVYVGDNAGAASFLGPDTELVDLAGRMVMPGLNDIHSHPWQGGLKELYECNFPFTATPQEVADTIAACAAANPQSDWITGGSWTSDFFANNEIASPRAFLDRVAGGKAVYLEDDSAHHAWVNSRALQLAGVNAATPDPEGGRFLRDASGEPTGVALETARIVMEGVLPEWSLEQSVAAVAKAAQLANSYGLTGMNEARTPALALAAYKTLEAEGRFTTYVIADMQTVRGQRVEPQPMAQVIEAARSIDSPVLRTRFAKLYLDGVPTGSRSALMLAPYTTNADYPEPTRGISYIAPVALEADLAALDAAGITVKIHTAGDGSVRVALDAIEAVRKRNGDSGLRHELAHAGYIDPADLPRFAQLDVMADLSPYLWYPRPIIDAIVAAVGERAYEYFPIKDLLDSGADVGLGSDWPSAAASMNPWPAIEAMVTRRNPDRDDDATALWPEQAIRLAQALDIATRAGARAYRLEDVTGSIEAGKSADLIVLNQNVFDVAPQRIGDTQPDLTLFQGQVVYRRE